MAISRIELDFYGRLMSAGLITGGGDILEFGESEFAEDPMSLLARLASLVSAERLQRARLAIQAASQSRSRYQRRYGVARALYAMIFDPARYTSADLFPAPRSIWADLNRPFNLKRQFDYCINNGTSEHVFNQANVFRAMHDHTKAGGLMIHWTPTSGWADHGLFNAQPNFFFDLAAANQYRIEHLEAATHGVARPLASRDAFTPAVAEHPELRESLLCVALRKLADAPFVMPMQGQSAVENAAAAAFARVFSETHACGWQRRDRPNLALGKPASQSSTSEWSWNDDPKLDASGGNDGVVTGTYGFHTDFEDRPWWSVDLTQPEAIREIVIYNRLDAPGMDARAGYLRIEASPDHTHWIELAAFRTPIMFGGADGHPFRLTLAKPLMARYVRVGLMDKNHLHLDEIEIY